MPSECRDLYKVAQSAIGMVPQDTGKTLMFLDQFTAKTRRQKSYMYNVYKEHYNCSRVDHSGTARLYQHVQQAKKQSTRNPSSRPLRLRKLHNFVVTVSLYIISHGVPAPSRIPWTVLDVF
jgi:hypothetical protein